MLQSVHHSSKISPPWWKQLRAVLKSSMKIVSLEKRHLPATYRLHTCIQAIKPHKMKAILVATHIIFTAIGIFLALKCNNPKNSEAFKSIITELSQASSHLSSSFLHLSSDIGAFLCNSIFFQTTLKEEIHPSSGPLSNNFSAPQHHSTLMNQLLVDVMGSASIIVR